MADDLTESSGDDAGPEDASEDTNICAEGFGLASDDSHNAPAECSNDDGNRGSSYSGPDTKIGTAETQPSSLRSQSQDEGNVDSCVESRRESKNEESCPGTTGG